MTPAGFDPAIPGALGQCPIYRAAGPWSANRGNVFQSENQGIELGTFGLAANTPVMLALQCSQVLENSRPCASPARLQNEFLAPWGTLLDHRRSTAATGLAAARSQRAACLATFPNHLMKTAETRDRARDLQIFSLTLSQLSYRGCDFSTRQALYQYITAELNLVPSTG